MAKETVESLVPGGKATAAPPLGPALGPLKVNIGEVVKAINEKTKGFDGMQVPVKVIVDTDTKAFEIEVGTPPASVLIKKEANIEKGASNPKMDKVADLRIEQVIKIAKMKEGNLAGKDLKAKIKEVIGTCNSLGVMVEGVPAKEAIQQVNAGAFDAEIKSGKTELSADELKELEEERKKLEEEAKQRREQFMAQAKKIITENAGKEPGKIKAALTEAKLPVSIIEAALTEAGITTAAAAAAAAGKPGAEAPKK
ncbi:50S ribosomal protein L11 [Candidatus Woesearchaeota archaeon]|nr:50S ribosomal protein L11 [Candidatus Woesearchaeota archaeon]